jgi:alkylhydroperoxidase family enzyme
LPGPTKAALSWADVVLGGGTGPARDAALAELRSHFDDAQIVELTYAMGTFIGYSKQIVALGLEPEDLPLLVIPTPGAD